MFLPTTSLITNDAKRMFVDFNTGDYWKVLYLGELDLDETEKGALIAVH
jgi:hypothetical protein